MRGRADVVSTRLGQRVVAERNRGRGRRPGSSTRARTEHRPARRREPPRKQLVEQRDRAVGASREPVEAARPDSAACAGARVVRGQLGRELRQLRGRGGRSAGGGLLGGGVEAGRRSASGPSVASARCRARSSGVRDGARQGPVDRTALPGGAPARNRPRPAAGARIGDARRRARRRLPAARPRVPPAPARGRRTTVRQARPSAGRARQRAGVRPGSRRETGPGGHQGGPAGFPARESPAWPSASRACGPVRARARGRKTDFPRSPRADARARAGSAQARAAARGADAPRPRPSGPTKRRSNRCPESACSNRARPSQCRHATSRAGPRGRLGAAAAPPGARRRGGSIHWMSSSATTTGPSTASTRRTSTTAIPIACASGRSSPGSASRSATASACARGAAIDREASTTTAPKSSESAANENDASA